MEPEQTQDLTGRQTQAATQAGDTQFVERAPFSGFVISHFEKDCNMVGIYSKDHEDNGDDGSEGPAPLVDSSGSDSEATCRKDARQEDTESEGEDITDEAWIKLVQDIRQRSKSNSTAPKEGEWKERLANGAQTEKGGQANHDEYGMWMSRTMR